MAAVIAVGFNASYGIWLSQARREPQHELHVLKGIKTLDDRWANPAYGVLLVTGIINVFIGHLGFTTFWVLTAIILYAALALMGALIFTPTLRRQIDVFQAAGPDSPAYRALSRRGQMVGVTLAVLVVVIIFLMVTKPSP